MNKNMVFSVDTYNTSLLVYFLVCHPFFLHEVFLNSYCSPFQKFEFRFQDARSKETLKVFVMLRKFQG